MKCEPITMPDGTMILSTMKRGAELTESDKRILAEWVDHCRERSREAQRKRNRSGNARTTVST